MTNVMEGIQFRVKPRDIFSLAKINNWQDIPEGKTSFAADVEFRVKPDTGYSLSVDNKVPQLYASRAEASTAVFTALDKGGTCLMEQVEILNSPPAKLQVWREGVRSIEHNTFFWVNVTASTTGTGVWAYGKPTVFRIRPDFYYRVAFANAGTVTGAVFYFDDSVELSKHLDKKLREDCGGFSVTRLRY